MPAVLRRYDTDMLSSMGRATQVVTIEDRRAMAGSGWCIADRVCAIDPEIAVGVLGLRTRFIPHTATPDEILSRLGLNPARVAETVKELGRAFLD